MKPHPTVSAPKFLCFIFFELLIIISYIKDKVKAIIGPAGLMAYETRTSIFPTINDVHLKDIFRYDLDILCLEEGR